MEGFCLSEGQKSRINFAIANKKSQSDFIREDKSPAFIFVKADNPPYTVLPGCVNFMYESFVHLGIPAKNRGQCSFTRMAILFNLGIYTR